MSSSFRLREKKDANIIDFCKKFPLDTKCLCINPPAIINSLQVNTFMPYYCWYKPCHEANTYKSLLLERDISLCSYTNCIIDIGDIILDGGNIIITNKCGSELMNVLKKDTYKKKDFNYKKFNIIPLFNNNMFISLFIIFFYNFIF